MFLPALAISLVMAGQQPVLAQNSPALERGNTAQLAPTVPALAPTNQPLFMPGPAGPGTPQSVPLNAPQALPAAPAPTTRSGEGALQAIARFGRESPVITGGLHWRIYADRPDSSGVFRMLREDRSAQPTFVLPAGRYIIHVSFGLASVAKPVQIRNETVREVLEIAAGGLAVQGKVGDVRIPTGQISFDVFKGSQFEQGDRRPIAASVATGDVVLLPEGTYYILSKYGDGNAVVRSDIRVQSGRLTDVIVTHRAAAIMLKLVSNRGGEALANTDWAVMSPAGDVITESKGAFPRVILAEGEYKVIARNDNKVYQQDLKVITGVDGEIEVLAR